MARQSLSVSGFTDGYSLVTLLGLGMRKSISTWSGPVNAAPDSIIFSDRTVLSSLIHAGSALFASRMYGLPVLSPASVLEPFGVGMPSTLTVNIRTAVSRAQWLWAVGW